MEWIRVCWLPTAMLLAQAALWPGGSALAGQRIDPSEAAVLLVGSLLAALGLVLRTRWPVAALAWVAAVVCAGRQLHIRDEFWVTAAMLLVALYSVAARGSGRVTAAATVVLLLAYLTLINDAAHDEFLTAVGGAAALTLTPVVLGRARHRWRLERQLATRRLARAEADRQRAAAAERQRLARELHDVAAHYLTAVVVTAGAAEAFADTRPDLVGQALAAANRSGREALTALHRLVTVVGGRDPGRGRSLPGRIDELAAEAARLGQAVTVSVTGTGAAPPEVTEAAYAIVREALTNVLRYAPAALVAVEIEHTPTAVVVTVTDQGGGAATACDPVTGRADLGSGHGLAGMRERASALGGGCVAGPVPGGGWRVRAELPVTTTADPPRPRPVRSGDAALAALVAWCLPTTTVLVAAVENGDLVTRPSVLAVTLVLLLLHAVPLAWRRRAPWTALLAALLSTLGWPLAVRYAALPGSTLIALIFAFGVELVLVYSIARYAPAPAASWLSAPLAASVFAGAGVTASAIDGVIEGERFTGQRLLLFATYLIGLFTTLMVFPLVGAWLTGLRVRSRHRWVRGAETAAVTRSEQLARAAADAERARIAAGLRDTVLSRVGRLIGAGTANDGTPVGDTARLATVTAEARTALAAMRHLLGALRAEEPSPRDSAVEEPGVGGGLLRS